MEHRGEIIEQAVRKSGMAISKIAQKLGKSRRWMYLMFDNPNVPFETIHEIAKIINYDFSDEIKNISKALLDPKVEYQSNFQNATYWREKYYALLDEHHELLKNTK